MKIVFVTPLHPTNIFNGASQRINKVIRTIRERGVDTHTIYTCQDSLPNSDAHATNMSENIQKVLGSNSVIPSEVGISNDNEVNGLDDYFPEDVIDRIVEDISTHSPDAVIVNYVFLSKILEYLPDNICGVIDTHDKLSRAHIYKSAGLDLGFFCTTEEEELRGLARADAILCIQHKESEYFSSRGINKVFTIGHLVDKKYIDRGNFRIPKRIGFLGSNHVFNSKSVLSFLANERFQESAKYFEYVFAGGICDNPGLAQYELTLLGRVDREMDFYNQVDVVINPVFFGTGLKIKTVDALSFGLPVIGTDIAFDGIHGDRRFHDARTISDIYDVLDLVKRDPGVVVKLSNLSKNIFEDYRSDVLGCYEDFIDYLHQYKGDKEEGRNGARRINHVVNLVESRKDSDLYCAQPITIRSMASAKAYVEAVSPQVSITHRVVLVGEEDIDATGLEGANVSRIQRTIRDFQGFESYKPLPLLGDLFDCVRDCEEDELIVYTNADISLNPIFYQYVIDQFEAGHDALIINRRTISKLYSAPSEYSSMVCDPGKDHPGFDCFVFKAGDLKRYVFDKTLIGVHLIGRVMFWNLVKYAENPLLVERSILTFHIGDDNSGKDENNNPLLLHNLRSAIKVLEELHSKKFEEAMNAISPNALKVFYRPNIYRDDILDKSKPIFIHSMFRTGSSYLWKKLDAHRKVTCYYEPLHESLAGLDHKTIQKNAENTAAFHGRLGSTNYWANYSSLLSDKKGVKGYDKKFAYNDYCRASPYAEFFSYISGLIEASGESRAILQFNRTALRQRWFVDNYKDSLNIYLLRNARSQFNSYFETYTRTNGSGFLRTQLAIVNQNISSTEFSTLRDLLPLPKISLNKKVSMKEFFDFYDNAMKALSPRHLYFMFFWEWLLGLRAALEAETFIINSSFVTESLVYRRKVELFFAEQYIYLDLSDCEVPDKEAKVLSSLETSIIERCAMSLMNFPLQEYADKLKRNGLGYLVLQGVKDNVTAASVAGFLNGEEFEKGDSRGRELILVLDSEQAISGNTSIALPKTLDNVDMERVVISAVFVLPMGQDGLIEVQVNNGRVLNVMAGSRVPVALLNFKAIKSGEVEQINFSTANSDIFLSELYYESI